MNKVEFPCGCPLFPCINVLCLCSFVWYGSNPDWSLYAAGLPYLTYVSASLSPASPSVRGLHPKASKWPPFLSKSEFTPKRSFPLFWIQQSGNRGEGKGCHVKLLDHSSYVSAHGVNNVLPDLTPDP